MKLKARTVILAVITAALIIASPAVMQLAIRENAQEALYEGRLLVWQINGEAQTNSTLRAAAADFERAGAHVFLTVLTLDASDAISRLSSGECPDILSCDSSFAPPQSLVKIDISGAPQPYFEFDGYLLPYAADAWCTYTDEDDDTQALHTVTYTHFRELANTGEPVIEDVLAKTDLVRYICAVSSGDPLRDAMSAKFCATMISVKNQRRVISKELIPAVLEYETFRPQNEMEDDITVRAYEYFCGIRKPSGS